MRIIALAFVGRVLAALFIAGCIFIGFGPSEWVALIAGHWADPWVARTAFILLGLITLALLVWQWWASRPMPPAAGLTYLRTEDSELGSAIRDMAWRSAWSRSFAAQQLANTLRPIDDRYLMQIASGVALDELMDGKLEARGRPAGAIEYETIPKEAWRLAALEPQQHPMSLWTVKVIPRGGVDTGRIRRLTNYDSIIVNSRQLESLWPSRNKANDAARERLLKKAKKAGVSSVEIEKLS
jgi:hypothetical protein